MKQARYPKRTFFETSATDQKLEDALFSLKQNVENGSNREQDKPLIGIRKMHGIPGHYRIKGPYNPRGPENPFSRTYHVNIQNGRIIARDDFAGKMKNLLDSVGISYQAWQEQIRDSDTEINSDKTHPDIIDLQSYRKIQKLRRVA